MLPLLCFRLNVSLKGFTLRKKKCSGCIRRGQGGLRLLGNRARGWSHGARASCCRPRLLCVPLTTRPAALHVGTTDKAQTPRARMESPGPRKCFCPREMAPASSPFRSNTGEPRCRRALGTQRCGNTRRAANPPTAMGSETGHGEPPPPSQQGQKPPAPSSATPTAPRSWLFHQFGTERRWGELAGASSEPSPAGRTLPASLGGCWARGRTAAWLLGSTDPARL